MGVRVPRVGADARVARRFETATGTRPAEAWLSRRVFRLLPVFATLAAGACDKPTAPTGGAPALLQIVSGDDQSNVVGQELPNPLVAKVVDSSSAPVKGQLVNFRVVSGGGSVFAGASI